MIDFKIFWIGKRPCRGNRLANKGQLRNEDSKIRGAHRFNKLTKSAEVKNVRPNNCFFDVSGDGVSSCPLTSSILRLLPVGEDTWHSSEDTGGVPVGSNCRSDLLIQLGAP